MYLTDKQFFYMRSFALCKRGIFAVFKQIVIAVKCKPAYIAVCIECIYLLHKIVTAGPFALVVCTAVACTYAVGTQTNVQFYTAVAGICCPAVA